VQELISATVEELELIKARQKNVEDEASKYD